MLAACDITGVTRAKTSRSGRAPSTAASPVISGTSAARHPRTRVSTSRASPSPIASARGRSLPIRSLRSRSASSSDSTERPGPAAATRSAVARRASSSCPGTIVTWTSVSRPSGDAPTACTCATPGTRCSRGSSAEGSAVSTSAVPGSGCSRASSTSTRCACVPTATSPSEKWLNSTGVHARPRSTRTSQPSTAVRGRRRGRTGAGAGGRSVSVVMPAGSRAAGAPTTRRAGRSG